MPGIIWLASYPKSGNTWLRAFLANFLANPVRPVPINDLPNFILGDNLLLHYEQFTSRKVDDLSDEDFARLRPRIHEWFARSRREDVFVKTHNAVSKVHGVPLITPSATAGAVYVIRNPMDVAVSFAHHYQVDYAKAVTALCEEQYSLPSSGGLLPQYLGSWSGHARSWTEAPGLTLHLMRYEDMTGKPVKAFGRLVRFLGLPKDNERLRKAIKFSSFRELAAQEQKTKFIESRPDSKSAFFRSGKAGAWREFLTDEQAAQLIDRHRHVMEKVGYLTKDGKLAV
ncbi:MAG: sulfotransferase domain-containing protein [Rhodospirillales bacterium]|nr:sulfotransferase domain-containing protein [Rhodospirillales bacterium]